MNNFNYNENNRNYLHTPTRTFITLEDLRDLTKTEDTEKSEFNSGLNS